MSDKPKLMMAVSDENASQLIEIEAMRQIVDNLRRLNDRSEEQSKLMHNMDKRLDRIEQNKLDRMVEKIVERVDALERKEDRREGAMGLAKWVKDFGPWLLAVLLAMVAALGWEHKV